MALQTSYYCVIITAITFILGYRLVKKPKALLGIPTLPVATLVKLMLSPNYPYRPVFNPYIPPYKGVLSLWLGRWILVAFNPKIAKTILQHPEVIQKSDIAKFFPKTLFDRYMGSNLVMSNGEAWKRYRRVANPIFRKTWSPEIFYRYTKEMINQWYLLKNDDEFVVEVDDWFQRLTLDVLGNTILGYEVNSVVDTNSEILVAYRKVMESMQDIIWNNLHWFDRPWNPFRKSAWEAFYKLDKLFYSIIQEKIAELKEKKKTPDYQEFDKRNADLLTLMLESNELLQDGLSRKEIRDQLAIFFLAGHDTTALALNAIIYNLVRYPNWQEKLRNEMNENLDPLELPTHTTKLPYLDAVIRESLRLYPPITQYTLRTFTEDKVIEDDNGKSFTVPKNTPISMDVFLLHRNPHFWDKPEEFLPERWIKDDSIDASEDLTGSTLKEGELSTRYIPFGAGLRVCIGKNFSLLEQRVVLTTILREFELELPKDSIHSSKFQFYLSFMLKPLPLHIKFKKLKQ